MSHGTHMNESWHTYEWVMAHIWMSHGIHMNESWHSISCATKVWEDQGDTMCVAVCCSVLQCVAVCCSVLQCVAVCCSVLQWLQCVAVCCLLVRRSMWYHVCWSVLQCVAVCCLLVRRSMWYHAVEYVLLRRVPECVVCARVCRISEYVLCRMSERVLYRSIWYQSVEHNRVFSNVRRTFSCHSIHTFPDKLDTPFLYTPFSDTLIERTPPPREGFLFTMFPDQEPCVRDFTTRCDRRISSWNLLHTALHQGT